MAGFGRGQCANPEVHHAFNALHADLQSLLDWADDRLDVAAIDRQLIAEHMSAEIAALLDGKPPPARPF